MEWDCVGLREEMGWALGPRVGECVCLEGDCVGWGDGIKGALGPGGVMGSGVVMYC